MRFIKCNRCSADLTNEKHYEVGSIQFNAPGASMVRLTHEDEHGSAGYNTTESWVSYNDIHLCEICWDKENFKNYLPKLS